MHKGIEVTEVCMDKLLNSANKACDSTHYSFDKNTNYYDMPVPECATTYMRDMLKMCSRNLTELESVIDRTPAYMKRVLHWETLYLIIVNCEPANTKLVEFILSTYKSPKKWVMNTTDPDDAYTGYCTYSDIGTLYSEEAGIKFVDNDGKETIIEDRLARM